VANYISEITIYEYFWSWELREYLIFVSQDFEYTFNTKVQFFIKGIEDFYDF
jgi:hypothetical protein